MKCNSMDIINNKSNTLNNISSSLKVLEIKMRVGY